MEEEEEQTPLSPNLHFVLTIYRIIHSALLVGYVYNTSYQKVQLQPNGNVFRSQKEEGGSQFGGGFLGLCSATGYIWEELLPLLPELLDQPRVTTRLILDYFQFNYVS